MRVAIAASGLGHINRGVEAWARDLAVALREGGIDATLFQARGRRNAAAESVWCLRRIGCTAKLLGQLFRHLGAWRWGIGNDYEIEQASFCLALWPKIRAGFDVLHVQDPTMALIFEVLHRFGLSQPRVILGNGTETPPLILRHLSAVQQLAPSTSAAWAPHRPSGQRMFTIPNFVDTGTFCPGNRAAARLALGLPQDALIVLSSAALRKTHKRIDYLIREFAAFADRYQGKSLLVIAGAEEPETKELLHLGTALLGERVRFLVNHPRAGMPDLYRAADLFVLTSLYELFGIVLLEAMAAGLPVVCHDGPVFRYIVGPTGRFGDLTRDGALTGLIAGLITPASREPLSIAARRRVDTHFSTAVVVEQIAAMYREVIGLTGTVWRAGGDQPA